jgi:hypothetical protein
MSAGADELFALIVEYVPGDGEESIKLPPQLSVASDERGAADAANIRADQLWQQQGLHVSCPA